MTVLVSCPRCWRDDVGFTAGLSACLGWLDRHDRPPLFPHEEADICPGSGSYVRVNRDKWEAARLPVIAPETVLDAPVTAERYSVGPTGPVGVAGHVEVARELLIDWLGAWEHGAQYESLTSRLADKTRRFLKETE